MGSYPDRCRGGLVAGWIWLWRNWYLGLQWDFTAKHCGGLARQAQIPVAGQGLAINVQWHKRALNRQFVRGRRQFKHGSAFIHFIEHRAIDHRAAGGNRIVSLTPIKRATVPRDLVERTPIEVVPGESRKNDGHVAKAVGGGVSKIRNDQILLEAIGLSRR